MSIGSTVYLLNSMRQRVHLLTENGEPMEDERGRNLIPLKGVICGHRHDRRGDHYEVEYELYGKQRRTWFNAHQLKAVEV